MVRALILTLLLSGFSTIWSETGLAQTPPADPRLAGVVKDETGAVMQAAPVRVFKGEAAEPVAETVTNEQGAFSLDLPAGEYRLEVSAPAFATFNQTVNVAPNMDPLAIVLALETVQETVVVELADDEQDPLTTMSLTSTTLTGDELLDLPQNEEEMVEYLLTLAGADITGDIEEDLLANFIIDGFRDGRMPRPDEIAQIIIDPNSLSADGSGPRIEIVTRPGTGDWRRSIDFGFADESLNALTPGESNKPARQTRDMNFEMSGPVIPGFLEMDFEVSTRNDERAANSLRAITPTGNLFAGVVRPEIEREFAIEGEIDLGGNHSLDVGFDYSTERSENSGVGGFTLPERGSNDRGSGWTARISERTFGDNFTNDFRIQYGRETSREEPLTQGFSIDVADAFRGGGGTGRSSDERTNFRIEDRMRMERGEWRFQLGGNIQYRNSINISEDNFNGTFDFASLHDYCYATNFAGVNCQETAAIVNAALAQGVPPTYLNARGNEVEITGVPTTFTQASGNSRFEFSELGFSAFFQADRSFADRASLRLGVRYEATNHSLDYMRLNPTINFQYRLTPSTTVSFGSQLSFRDFRDTERLLRNDGSTYRRELTISSPSFPDPFLSGDIEVDETTSSLYVLDPDYQSPYTINPQVSLNQQLGGVRLSFSYSHNYGIHQQRTRNINAPFPGTPLPEEILALPRSEQREVIDQMRPFYPIVGNIRQLESTGRSFSRSFRIQVRPRRDVQLIGMRFSGNFSYSYNYGEDDNDFNNPYVREWGLSQRQHQIQSQFRIRMPDEAPFSNPLLSAIGALYTRTNFNFNLRAQSGRPYSISSGMDLNGDQSNRDRPVGVPRNSETGPGNWNLDMTFTKEIRIETGDIEPGLNSANQRGGGGGGGGDFGGRGGRGGGFGGGDDFRIRFQARVNNLLNHSQPRSYSGVLSSPLFGKPTGYTGGRTITLGMRFEF